MASDDDVIDFNSRRAARGDAMFDFASFAFHAEGDDERPPSVAVIDGEQPICIITAPPLHGICMTREDAIALGKELIACATSPAHRGDNRG